MGRIIITVPEELKKKVDEFVFKSKIYRDRTEYINELIRNDLRKRGYIDD